MDWTVTKELQPFRLLPRAPRESTPWGINELARLDRHRAVHTSGLWVTEDTRVDFAPPGGGTVDRMELPRPLEHGAVIASGRILQAEVNVHVVAEPDLAIESVSAYRGTPDLQGIWVKGLIGMIGFVHEALAAYEDPAAFLNAVGNPG